MNTFKTFKAVLVILILSILAGCSDQITSSLDREINPGGSGNPKDTVSETGDQVWSNYFNTKIKLGPNREYTFNVSNTGLAKFTAIDVENVSIERNENNMQAGCGYISIHGKGTKYDIALSCHSKGFDVQQITLKNLSARIYDLNVSLLGIKAKKNPNSEE